MNTKAVSPIFEEKGKKNSYLLALTFVLILGFCTLIAYTAFASTEADADIQTVTVGNHIIDAASGTVIAELKKAWCDLTAQANKNNVIKTSVRAFELKFKGDMDIAAQMKGHADRAKAGGYDAVEIVCYSNKNTDQHRYTDGIITK
ncbi:MAG: hypothetical protein M1610_00955 [Nitrospirae bacterium]|nr:hypothetical protein [Nitrospirota bacterium]MDA8338362.1 hypothetical protein [Nitrospiraceae bacterium]